MRVPWKAGMASSVLFTGFNTHGFEKSFQYEDRPSTTAWEPLYVFLEVPVLECSKWEEVQGLHRGAIWYFPYERGTTSVFGSFLTISLHIVACSRLRLRPSSVVQVWCQC